MQLFILYHFPKPLSIHHNINKSLFSDLLLFAHEFHFQQLENTNGLCCIDIFTLILSCNVKNIRELQREKLPFQLALYFTEVLGWVALWHFQCHILHVAPNIVRIIFKLFSQFWLLFIDYDFKRLQGKQGIYFSSFADNWLPHYFAIFSVYLPLTLSHKLTYQLRLLTVKCSTVPCESIRPP